MAKILNKDPITYQKERDSFLRELRQFHDGRGTPFRRVPKIHGHEVDLYLLYVLVTAHGGWEKVNNRSEWDTLSEQFGVPRNCVNGGIALKQIYIRFLERYEKLHFLGEDVDRDDDDESSDGRNHRRWSARVLHSVPLAYNHHQHQVSDQARQTMGLSTETYKSSEYDRLSLSLLCPLPNEHDFAINVCTLLSNEGKHTLRLEKCPRLVDFLLAHAGVYTHASMRETFTSMFTHMRHQSVDRFWSEMIDDLDFRELTSPHRRKKAEAAAPSCVGPSSYTVGTNASCENGGADCERLQDSLASSQQQQTDSECSELRTLKEQTGDYEMTDLSNSISATTELVKPSSESNLQQLVCNNKEAAKTDDKPKIRMIDVPDEELPRLPVNKDMSALFNCMTEDVQSKAMAKSYLNPEDYELFSLGRGLGTQDPLGQRILQIATIMRNLSFEDDNIPVLGRNPAFIRFSLLCSQSHYSCLSQLGLDMLGQVAGELVIDDPQTDTLATMLLSTVTKGLGSADRFVALSCLEVLNKLSQNEQNEEVMLKCLEQKVYEQICSFLTLHDIMLLIYTLECLYSLSSLGERACNSIVRVHGAIDTLVSLITVEAQSYGPRACILMRVVERLPDQASQQTGASGSVSTVSGAVSNMITTQNGTTMTQLSSVTATAATPVRSSAIASRTNTVTPQRLQPVGAPVAIAPATASASPLPQSPQQLQQQHQQQQQLQENEQFALAWLRATYEPASGSSVEQTELYRQYLSSCAKIGRRGVIASLHFPRCVRSVFGGTVGPNAKQPATLGSSTEYHYEGIKVRKTAVNLLASPPASTANIPVRKQQPPSAPTPPPPVTVSTPEQRPASPAVTTASIESVPPATSPILKAQLSAPPKPRESTKPETKSQVLAHPHLTQALLGSSSQQPQSTQPQQQSQPQQQQQPQQTTPARPLPAASPSSSVATPGPSGTSGPSSPAPPSSSSSSLIKSLLASKVNTVGESMSMSSIVLPAASASSAVTDVQQHQVTQRQQQQRLLQQQLQSTTTTQQQSTSNATILQPPSNHSSPPPLQPLTPARTPTRPAILKPVPEPKGRQLARVNGARGLPVVNSTLQQQTEASNESNVEKKSDSVAENHVASATQRKDTPLLPPPPPRPRLDEDSDSAASTANSLVSSSGAVSTDGDGENSLTSFEGILLNGIPHSLDIDAADTASNDGSRSCDSTKDSKGSSVKMKGMLADLLEKKVVLKEPVINGVIGKELRISDKGLEIVENHVDKGLKQESVVSKVTLETPEQMKLGIKRNSTSVVESQEAKKPLVNPPINGNAHSSEVNSETNELKAEEKAEAKPEPPMTPATAVRQLFIAQSTAATDGQQQPQGQQLILGPRQIIVAPSALQQGQVMFSQGQVQMQQGSPQLKGQIIVQPGQRQVLVQNQQVLVSTGQMMAQGPMIMTTQSGAGQFIVTQALQGSIGAPGQAYVVAQSQGLVQGQAPTVLVTQTPQQQGTNAKTIIILHQQAGQKLPTQGQQVMVQLPRSAVQGPGGTIQGMTLSQGAGGQVTVSLPGGVPVVTRTMATTNTTMVQPPRILAPANVTPNKPQITGVATPAIVQNPAKKLPGQPVVCASPAANTTQSKVQPTQGAAATMTRPTSIKTLSTEGEGSKISNSLAAPNSGNVSGGVNQQLQRPVPAPEMSPFLCEWRGCMRSFKSANEVYMHACRTHCPTGSEDVQCLWERCDGMKRKRFSLMTHLSDRHCNSDVLRMMAVRRKQMAQSGRSEIPPPQPPPPHPGYAPNAALHAIKRHALEFVNPKELMQRAAAAPVPPTPPTRSGPAPTAAQPVSRPGPSPAEQDDNEGPVTKSIRLTSSLILRNLVIYSTNGRRFLRSYEPHLASVALSNVESSRTIAQVLYDMSQRTEQS